MTKERQDIVDQIKNGNFHPSISVVGEMVHILNQSKTGQSGFIIHEDGSTYVFIDAVGLHCINFITVEEIVEELRFKNFK